MGEGVRRGVGCFKIGHPRAAAGTWGWGVLVCLGAWVLFDLVYSVFVVGGYRSIFVECLRWIYRNLGVYTVFVCLQGIEVCLEVFR